MECLQIWMKLVRERLLLEWNVTHKMQWPDILPKMQWPGRKHNPKFLRKHTRMEPPKCTNPQAA